MMLIPAIDLKRGRCVRLYQGKYDRETAYSADPVRVARDFEKRGARRIHLVDLDSAVTGSSEHFPLIRKICRSVNIPVECGGGIRDNETAYRYLDAGAAEVILGTVVMRYPETALEILGDCGPDRVQIGFDFDGDNIFVKGWTEHIRSSVTGEIMRWKKHGIRRFILTDITKDGAMKGPNMRVLKAVAERTGGMITAAGGVSGREDIYRLAELEPLGIDRVISGKAIYEGAVLLEDFA